MNNLENLVNNLNVIYEDNHILVVEKIVRVPMQQDKSGDISMIDVVREYIRIKYNKPGNVYVGMVHRLDRMVGGVCVFAKTSKAMSRLSAYVREREIKKRYIAILNGKLDKKEDTIENYLVKNERINMSRVCDKKTKGAKEAKLQYKVQEYITINNKPYTVVKVNLLTGRHHQIRVQFANLGYPLYGDQKYGQKINKVGQNLALYSYYLSFLHPTKDEYLEYINYPINKDVFSNIDFTNYKEEIWI